MVLALKVRLFLGMLIAANTAALAIWLCFKHMLDNELSYQYCMGIFLIARVVLFMANKQMPLNDENVAFMSSERILWNGMTILIMAFMMGAFFVLSLLISSLWPTLQNLL